MCLVVRIVYVFVLGPCFVMQSLVLSIVSTSSLKKCVLRAIGVNTSRYKIFFNSLHRLD